jgi:hypothetical protein
MGRYGPVTFAACFAAFLLYAHYAPEFPAAQWHNHTINYIGEDGHEIILDENTNATDVRYDQLISFIRADQTDSIHYERGVFTCGDYAEMVHNNAEKAGIRCAFVGIHFVNDGVGHACNAFNTTDQGVIYIDCTDGDSALVAHVGQDYVPQDITQSGYTYKSIGTIEKITLIWD